MAGALTAAIAAAFSGVTADPYFEYTTLLLPGSGTNGTQNNSFVDSSANAFPITRNPLTGPNAPTQGTFSPFSQTGWGNYFDGTGDNLVLPSSSNLAFGTGDFCVETWIYWGTSSVNDVIYSNVLNSGGGDAQIEIYINSSNKVVCGGWNTNFLVGSTNVTSNAWTHIAVCRSGTTMSLFLNGSRDATTTTSNNFSSTNAFNVGRQASGAYDFLGYISNLRVVKGSTPYDATSSSLTVPTAPLTAITNTQLLTCQSNRFKDNSTNNFTITRNGDTSVVAFSPFNPTASWSAATYGGSGYFDGSGDYLSAGSAADWAFLSNTTAAWTIEFWVYNTTTGSAKTLFDTNESTSSKIGVTIQKTSSEFVNVFITYGTVLSFIVNGTSTSTLTANTWNHVFISYDQSLASSNLVFYINGVAAGTANKTGNTPSSSNPFGALSIGTYGAGGGQFFTGYFSSARISNVVRTPPSSVPTSPYTSDTDTKLLLNFTNAGIYDATSKNDLETVGDAQISNTTAKWGSTSIKFDGTGDYLRVPDSPLFSMGSGNFTIDGWVYRSGSGAVQIICCQGGNTGSSTSFGFRINSSNQLSGFVYSGTTVYITNSTATVSANQWVYVAMVRDGNTITLYINGSADGTVSVTGVSVNDSAQPLGIGTYGDTVGDYFNGYIQDLRITRGYARTITTPTAAFPTL